MARTSTIDKAPQLPRPKRGANKTETVVSKGVRKYRDTGNYENAALIDENKPLTAQQLSFVKAWAMGESISSASQRAGYSAGDGFCYRMTHMPNVLKVYRAEKALYEAASQMTRKRVMDGLLEGIEMAKLMAEPMTLISGWREVGKMCGYYEPTKHVVDINVKGDITMRQMASMSDAQLLDFIAKSNTMPLLPAPEDTP